MAEHPVSGPVRPDLRSDSRRRNAALPADRPPSRAVNGHLRKPRPSGPNGPRARLPATRPRSVGRPAPVGGQMLRPRPRHTLGSPGRPAAHARIASALPLAESAILAGRRHGSNRGHGRPVPAPVDRYRHRIIRGSRNPGVGTGAQPGRPPDTGGSHRAGPSDHAARGTGRNALRDPRQGGFPRCLQGF